RERFAPPSTVHGRFRQWVKAGLFERIYRAILERYDDELGIDWKWLAMDGCITKAPLGGEATGRSPVDRGKSGTKRSVLVARRWIVERTHAWHNKFRRLHVRWERKADHYLAMLHLASTLQTYRILAAA